MDETKKGFMQNIGDLSFKKIDETNYEFSIKVEEKFLNTGKRSVTVNLDIKFISAGKQGDILVGKVEILKKTKTLVFINCKILNSKGIVATASGTWKILL